MRVAVPPPACAEVAPAVHHGDPAPRHPHLRRPEVMNDPRGMGLCSSNTSHHRSVFAVLFHCWTRRRVGVHRVEFLRHEFCAKFLCTICLVFLRICGAMRSAVPLLPCAMQEDLLSKPQKC